MSPEAALYLVQKLSLRGVAAHIGISQQAVRKRLIKQGVPMRPPRPCGPSDDISTRRWARRLKVTETWDQRQDRVEREAKARRNRQARKAALVMLCPAPGPKSATLLAIGDGCRFPVGALTGADQLFCGEAQTVGAYCTRHHRVCHGSAG